MFLKEHMFCAAVEGFEGEKLWKGFNLLRWRRRCAVNTPVTSSLVSAKGSSSLGSTRLEEEEEEAAEKEEEEEETPQMLSLRPLYLAARCQEDKLRQLQDHNKAASRRGDILGEGVMCDAN